MPIIYTSTTCHFCKDMKRYLTEKGIEFIEKNVSIEQSARNELIELGVMSVPVLVDGDHKFFGFNKDALDAHYLSTPKPIAKDENV